MKNLRIASFPTSQEVRGLIDFLLQNSPKEIKMFARLIIISVKQKISDYCKT